MKVILTLNGELLASYGILLTSIVLKVLMNRGWFTYVNVTNKLFTTLCLQMAVGVISLIDVLTRRFEYILVMNRGMAALMLHWSIPAAEYE